MVRERRQRRCEATEWIPLQVSARLPPPVRVLVSVPVPAIVLEPVVAAVPLSRTGGRECGSLLCLSLWLALCPLFREEVVVPAYYEQENDRYNERNTHKTSEREVVRDATFVGSC